MPEFCAELLWSAVGRGLGWELGELLVGHVRRRREWWRGN